MASSASEMGVDRIRIPATLDSYATPTPQTSLLAAAISPAHRVPWESSLRRGIGKAAWSLKSQEPSGNFESGGISWIIASESAYERRRQIL